MTARSAIVALAVAGSTIALGAAPRQTPTKGGAEPPYIALGIACGDGLFVPLAERSNGAWTPLLVDDPETFGFFYAALTPQALRLPRLGWTFYPRGVGDPRPLTLGAVRRKNSSEGAECIAAQSYDSDGPRVPGPVAFPDGTRALARVTGVGIFGQVRFERGEDVTTQPDEPSRRVAARVVSEVDAAERQLDRRTGDTSPLRQFAGRKEVRSVVRLRSMVRHRIGEEDWYFFQAQKRYRELYVFQGKRMQKEWADVLLHGWVRLSSTAIAAFPAEASFIDDGPKTGSFYQLAGVVVVDDRIVWITEGEGYEWQWVELFEATRGGRSPHSVLTIDTGGS